MLTLSRSDQAVELRGWSSQNNTGLVAQVSTTFSRGEPGRIWRNHKMAKVARRRGTPYNPAAPVHDRRATDLLRNAQVGAMEVDDPMGLELGDRIVTLRNLRDDPLARLHDRRQIDEVQYQGGRAFQEDFETAERGPQAIDPSKEYVDGGRMPEPITERQRKAVLRLNRANRELGLDGSALALAVLVHRQTFAQLMRDRDLVGERWERYFGMRFRECLDRLARLYGFAT